MKQTGRMLQRITDAADLIGEQLPGQSVVELLDDNRVLIENHGGIVHYSPCRICVRMGYGQLEVCGSAMELLQMTRSKLVISGRPESVTLHRRNGK